MTKSNELDGWNLAGGSVASAWFEAAQENVRAVTTTYFIARVA